MSVFPTALRTWFTASALAVALLIGGIGAGLSAAQAQSPVDEATYDEPLEDLQASIGPPGAPPATEEELDAIAYRVSKGLRCPVCQTSIIDSASDSATNMRTRVRELVSYGYSKAQIEDYFVQQYDDWILLAPPAQGLNWLVWIGPALAGGIALAALATVVVKWRREPDPVPLPSETGAAPLDTYEQRLLDEIDR
ncbi:MAG: cytochrome c-type biogenesis protein CcmH [Myxococcota bacterium]